VDRFLAFDRPAASEVDPSPLAEQRAVLLAEEFLSEAGKGGWVLPIGREVQVS
jgi:hypothetical protein